jgi:eukaryotic-like serine/threonine-protein kinase
MSPEQARGTAGDFRTDQFSFGAMFYEIATGHSAFRRDTVADTLAAVLHDEPKPIAELNPRIPVTFAWIVEQCLAKDSGERYAATEDLARELRRVREHLRHTLAAPADPTSSTRSRPWQVVAGVAAAACVAAFAVLYLVLSTAEPRLTFTPIASAATYEGTPVWSPDGQSLAWVADVDGVLQAFVRRIGDAVATQVTRGLFDAEEPFWAPDGRTIYFISRAGIRRGLWSVGTAGGRAELVLEDVNHAAIDPAGTRFALWRGDDSRSTQQLWWAGPNGRDPVQEPRAPFGDNGFGTGGQLRFRPDGEAMLVWAFGNARVRTGMGNYYLVPTAADQPITEVLSGIANKANLQPVSWLPDNRHLVVGVTDALGGNRHLWIADTQSPATRQMTATHTNETWPTVSSDGKRIAYASEEVDFDLALISEDGRSQSAVLATARNEMDPAWAPNGDQFAFVTDRRGAVEIWTRSRDGQWDRPIVTAADFSDGKADTLGALAFSPDGRRLAYQHRGSSGALIWLSPTTGGAPVRLATNSEWSYQDAPAWSPDGDWIALVINSGSEAMSLVKIRVGSTEATTLIAEVVPFTRPAWSPDGRWIACESKDGLVKVPVDGGDADVMFAEPPLAFAWSLAGRHILALVEAEAVGHMALVEIDAVTHQVKTLNGDLGTIPIALTPIRGFSLVKGRGILTSFARARSDIWMLEGFQLPRTGFPWFQAFFR